MIHERSRDPGMTRRLPLSGAHRMRLAGLALCIATNLPAQTPASVTGTLISNDVEVTLKSASAVSYPGGTGRFVSVLLSDKAANTKAFAEYTRIGAGERYVPGTFEGAWASLHMEKGFSGFTFSIDTDRRILTNQILVGGQDKIFSISPDDLVLEVKSIAPRLTGRIRSKEAVLDLGEYKMSLDATFDVAVAEAGK
ncbi:MAG: hypothetical protein H7Z74_08785 [Anaerolineae bacterium]|nr:hypothetical protein [Gemmatimonadaceae bacterium]